MMAFAYSVFFASDKTNSQEDRAGHRIVEHSDSIERVLPAIVATEYEKIFDVS